MPTSDTHATLTDRTTEQPSASCARRRIHGDPYALAITTAAQQGGSSHCDDMPTLEQTELDEPARVEAWRLATLIQAGYKPHRAELLATDPDVDLHQAVSLLEHGCSQHLAIRILL